MRKTVVLFTLVAMIFCLFSCEEKHYDENNISELYNREWIIGKTREQIRDKYGDYDREFVSDKSEILGAYYVNYDDEWVMGLPPSYIHDTYFVVFNQDDVAIDAYFSETSRGG